MFYFARCMLRAICIFFISAMTPGKLSSVSAPSFILCDVLYVFYQLYVSVYRSFNFITDDAEINEFFLPCKY